MDQAQSSVPRIEVDVVVIGGGIQGLWLLGDLIKAGYNAILLERAQPGFGQTGHSHVFIHQGHMYAAMPKQSPNDTGERIEKLGEANVIWQEELQQGRLKNLQPITSSFYMGFRNASPGEEFQRLCWDNSLLCDEMDPIPSEFGSSAQRVYRADGMCFDSNQLLSELLEFGNLKDRVGSCKIVSVQADPSGGFHLIGHYDEDASLHIHAGAVVLSAGSGNEHVQGLLGLDTASNGAKQQTVKTFMLLVGEIADELPAVTGMYPQFGGMFMVSRKDSEGRTVWLIGDRQRKLVPVPGEITAFDGGMWFRSIKKPLENLFPNLMKNAANYRWGIYEASKAEPWTENGNREGGQFPMRFQFKRVPGLPLWLAWPSLLTFAPLVASLIAGEIQSVMTAKSANTDWNVWRKLRVPLIPEQCRWKMTPLLSWSDFKRCYAP